jgi:hypothetical protein
LTKIKTSIEREYLIPDLTTKSRKRKCIEAREVFYYIADKIGIGRIQIANHIGNSHSNVTIAVNKIKDREELGDDKIPNIAKQIILDYELEELFIDDEKEKFLSNLNKELADMKNKYADLLLNINRSDLRVLLEEMVDLPDDIVKDTIAYVKARKVVFKGNQDKVKMYISNTEGIDPRQQWG